MDSYHSTVVFLEDFVGVHQGTGVLTHSHMCHDGKILLLGSIRDAHQGVSSLRVHTLELFETDTTRKADFGGLPCFVTYPSIEFPDNHFRSSPFRFLVALLRDAKGKRSPFRAQLCHINHINHQPPDLPPHPCRSSHPTSGDRSLCVSRRSLLGLRHPGLLRRAHAAHRRRHGYGAGGDGGGQHLSWLGVSVVGHPVLFFLLFLLYIYKPALFGDPWKNVRRLYMGPPCLRPPGSRFHSFGYPDSNPGNGFLFETSKQVFPE